MEQQANRYKIQDNKLTIADAVLTFDYPIRESLEVSGMLIVLLEKKSRTIYNENVFGISLTEKKVKWQIAKLQYATGTDCPFIDVFIFEGKVRLNNWCDIFLIINPITGEILERSLPMKY